MSAARPSGEFRVGDIVSLISGGPDMTVETTIANADPSRITIGCVWFTRLRDGDGNHLHWSGPNRGTFFSSILKLINEGGIP